LKTEVQRITSANTKVRRLGYFVLFSKTVRESPTPKQLLQQRILNEKIRVQNRKLLEEACKRLSVKRTTSEIVTGEICSEDAFQRYLETAIQLGLLLEFSGRLYNTKRGEILSALSNNDNPFRLSMSQSYLMLKALLERDYDYLRTTVLCSKRNGQDEYEGFLSMVKGLWQKKIDEASPRDSESYDKLKQAIRTEWKNPVRYYHESIKAPRLEWLLDLNVIEFWNIPRNRVTFHGNTDMLLDGKEEHYSYAFASYMKPLLKGPITYWKEIPSSRQDEIVEGLLIESFNLFRVSDAISKISASQFLEYCLSILSSSGVVCEIEDLDATLERVAKSKADNYRYVKIISEADRGYISRI